MKIDIGNALAEVAEPGIARTSLDRLDERVATAHERIERGRRDDEFGYAALNLPETTDPEAITEAVEPVAGAEYVLVVGIGGSALGAATLAEALGDSRILTLDNVDPREVSEVLSLLPLDDAQRNAICSVVPHPEYKEDLPGCLTTSLANVLNANRHAPLWLRRCRLNFMSHESLGRYLRAAYTARKITPQAQAAAQRLVSAAQQ